VQERALTGGDRERHAIRPPFYTPSYKTDGHRTVATISTHGQNGRRQFVKITMPMSTLLHNSPAAKRFTRPTKSAPGHLVRNSHRMIRESGKGESDPSMNSVPPVKGSISEMSSHHRPKTSNYNSENQETRKLTTLILESNQLGDHVSIPTAGEAFSVISSIPNLSASYHDDQRSSVDLDGLSSHSDTPDGSICGESKCTENTEPAPKTERASPKPTESKTFPPNNVMANKLEDLTKMRERIHDDLVKTRSETEQLVDSYATRKKPGLTYSDDEEEVLDAEDLLDFKF